MMLGCKGMVIIQVVFLWCVHTVVGTDCCVKIVKLYLSALFTGMWCSIHQIEYPIDDNFLHSHHPSAWHCIDIVRRIYILVTHWSEKVV